MTHDTTTPAPTANDHAPCMSDERIEMLWNRVQRPVEQDAEACGMDTWLVKFLRELRADHESTRNTLANAMTALNFVDERANATSVTSTAR